MCNNKKLKEIPKFKNEKEEREFWQTHDSTDYVDWSKAKIIMSNDKQCKKEECYYFLGETYSYPCHMGPCVRYPTKVDYFKLGTKWQK